MIKKKKKKKEFNWLTALNERLSLVRKGLVSKYPDDTDNALAHRAGEWPTCACGELCKALPRHSGRGVFAKSTPVDATLARYGSDFYFCVRRRQWGWAIKLFLKIEARTTLLLKKAKAKNQPTKKPK